MGQGDTVGSVKQGNGAIGVARSARLSRERFPNILSVGRAGIRNEGYQGGQGKPSGVMTAR